MRSILTSYEGAYDYLKASKGKGTHPVCSECLSSEERDTDSLTGRIAQPGGNVKAARWQQDWRSK